MRDLIDLLRLLPAEALDLLMVIVLAQSVTFCACWIAAWHYIAVLFHGWRERGYTGVLRFRFPSSVCILRFRDGQLQRVVRQPLEDEPCPSAR